MYIACHVQLSNTNICLEGPTWSTLYRGPGPAIACQGAASTGSMCISLMKANVQKILGVSNNNYKAWGASLTHASYKCWTIWLSLYSRQL